MLGYALLAAGVLAALAMFRRPATYIAKGMAAAERIWRSYAGEHDRDPSKPDGIVAIWARGAGTSFGVPPMFGVTLVGKLREWCGFAASAVLQEAGLNPALRNDMFEVRNVEAVFTYGARALVNPARYDDQVLDSGAWMLVKDYHARHGALRTWLDWSQIQSAATLDLQPLDVVVIDWNGNGKKAEHIGLVRAFDGRFLDTWEGNRTGYGPNGELWRESFVTMRYDLADPATRRLFYGFGRFSRLDFESLQYRSSRA